MSDDECAGPGQLTPEIAHGESSDQVVNGLTSQQGCRVPERNGGPY